MSKYNKYNKPNKGTNKSKPKGSTKPSPNQSNQNTSIRIDYSNNVNKLDEFIVRIFERIAVKLLHILENKRP